MANTDLDRFLTSLAVVERERPLIDDPPAEHVVWPVVSVDDHLLEPRDVFTNRLPAKFADRAPHVVEDEHGVEWWDFEGERVPILGTNAAVSWTCVDAYSGPVRYDQLRPGAYDVHARVKDMDISGIIASLCFPSMVFGFAGRRFAAIPDRELGFACMRAYNDWFLEEWRGAYPDRFIASQVPWLLDVEVAATEIRRNAERGFTAVNFSENPEKLGLPSIHSGYWDPFLAACEETATVVNLHVGSSSQTLSPSTDSPYEVIAALFQVNAIASTADWLFSLAPLRFPDIRLSMSEGGIGWLPSLMDRLEHMQSRYPATNDGGLATIWYGDVPPVEVLFRNFWFSSIYDPSTFRLLELFDADHIMMEVDYPHIDSTWPHTQSTLSDQLGHLDDETVRKLTSGNALRLYRLDAVPSPRVERGGDAAE